jgi:hypothetical protein
VKELAVLLFCAAPTGISRSRCAAHTAGTAMDIVFRP